MTGPEAKRGRKVEARSEPAAAATQSSARRSAIALVAACATPTAARLFEALLILRDDAPERHAFSVAEVFSGSGARARLNEADTDFKEAFGFKLTERLPGRATSDDAGGSPSSPAAVRLSDAFTAFLKPSPARRPSGALAELDGDSCVWAEIVAVAAREGGHHFLIRGDERLPRAVGDFADHLGAQGIEIFAFDRSLTLAATILKGELQPNHPTLVLVDRPLFIHESEDVAAALLEGGDPATLKMSWAAARVGSSLAKVRKSYLWQAPEAGKPSPQVLAATGGIIGPVRHDHTAAVRHIASRWPELGADGARVLGASVRDARDAAGLAAVARCALAAGLGEAKDVCALIASSAGALPLPSNVPFHPELIVCDGPGAALLRPGAACGLASGARILAHGPPGGGKSAFARSLAARISAEAGDARPVVCVLASEILAQAWGAMEKRLQALWRDAERDGAILIADEFETFCAVREYQGSNAVLGRSLTTEWLRALDAHPGVPLIATVNVANAIDRAVLRRFHFCIEVKDTLTPDRELLAWTKIFGLAPPPGWRPGGASLSDYAVASAQCRFLKQSGAVAHAEALLEASRARRGSIAEKRRGPLH